MEENISSLIDHFMRTISKSSFIRGNKCPKALYLHFFEPKERDETSESQQNIFNIGHNVGFLAQQLFPGGIDASRGEPGEVKAALKYTRELIEQGQQVIYEAAFSDGETLCYMDLLVKKEGSWYVSRCRRKIDVHQLFAFEDLTDIVIEKQAEVAFRLAALQEMLATGAMPEIEPGYQCNHPFGCDFEGMCHQEEENLLLSDVEDVRGGKEIRDIGALDIFRARLEYPLYFMDFETIMPAVPMYNDLEIHEGGTACLTYLSLYEDADPESVASKRENLLKYCQMDTLAMVKLIEMI